MYEGEWKKGKANGRGKFSWPSGATYEGEFKSGRMDGYGTFIGVDGDTYRGFWAVDKKHGFGEKRYANGDVYVGNWRCNLQDGEGRYIWSNGNEYIGEWRNGVIFGKGILIWVNGNRFEGYWENGVPKGKGVFTWADGSSCVGHWGKDFKGTDENMQMLAVTAARKRSSVDDGNGGIRSVNFPKICIWELDGDAGDITCDIVEASVLLNKDEMQVQRHKEEKEKDDNGVVSAQWQRSPRCNDADVKRPGHTISKGHKNYDLMLNLQLGIR